jgi:hypothetical protein
MDNSQEITALLTEIRDHLRENARRHAETLEFMRSQAQKTEERVERSISLQQTAIARQRSLQVVVLPIIVVLIGALGYVLFKIWGRW